MKHVMALCWAASQGDLNEVKRLVANGVNLDEADYDGRTCIHLAASEGHLNIIKFLMGKNVSITCKDRWGGTPLDDAVRHNHKAVIAYLNQQKKQS